MPTRRRDFERAFGRDLSAHVGKIAVDPILAWNQVRGGGAPPPFRAVAVNDGDRRLQRVHRVELDSVHECGFFGVARRHDEARESGVARAEHHRQNAADGAERSVQRQFSEREKALQRVAVHRLIDRHERERDGKVECGTLLANVGGRKINQQTPRGIGEAGVCDRGAHALASVGKRPVRQPDDG